MKILNSLQRVISYLPLGWLLLFVSFVIRIYVRLGRLPSYDNPDPKRLGFDIHHGLLFFNLFIVLGSILVWLPLTTLILFKDKKSLYRVDWICYVFFYLLFLSFLKFDFWGLSEWFTD